MRSKRRLLLLSVFLIVTLLAANLYGVFPALGNGVGVSVTTPALGEFNASTDTDVTFRYSATSEFVSGEIFTVTISPAVNTAVAACATPTTDIDLDSTPDGAFASYTTTGAIYTLTADTTDATTFATMCLNFQVDTDAGIYSIAVTDDNDDYGAVLIYVGDDNDVTVTAQVQPTLSFAIRNSADTSDTNICALGVLSTTAVSECEYRLKVGTNSNSGYDVDVKTNGDMTNDGTPGDDLDPVDLDRVTEDTLVTAGTEGYGIEFNGGASTESGVTVTETVPYDDDDTPLPTAAEGDDDLYSTNGPNNPGSTDTTNTALMTHRAAIDSATRTGNYVQIVTYYVTASF